MLFTGENDDIQLKGATDATLIGNVGDRIKVDSAASTTADRSGTGSLTALDTTVTANTQGMSTVIFTTSGTWVGTVRIEGTIDGGANWILLTATDGSQSMFATFTSNNSPKICCGGFQQVRLRMQAYTSGTANVTWNTGVGINFIQAWNTNSASLIVRARLQDINANSITSSSIVGLRPVDVNVVQAGAYLFRNLTGNATTTVKSGAGVLHTLTINNNSTGGTVTVYDNTAGSGTVIMTLQVGSPSGGLLSTSGTPGPVSLRLDIAFATGLTVVTAGSASNNITCAYQ